MKVNELRIENWVNVKDFEYFQIKRIDEKSVENELGFIFPICSLLPIQLTEEILLKCGFVKIENGYLLPILDYGYVAKYFEWRGDWSFGIEYFDSPNEKDNGVVYNFNGSGLKYLHQLQNLHFALTNEELEINL